MGTQSGLVTAIAYLAEIKMTNNETKKKLSTTLTVLVSFVSICRY